MALYSSQNVVKSWLTAVFAVVRPIRYTSLLTVNLRVGIDLIW